MHNKYDCQNFNYTLTSFYIFAYLKKICPIIFTPLWNWGSFTLLWIKCALIFSYHLKCIFCWLQRFALLQDFQCSTLLPHLLRREQEKQKRFSPPLANLPSSPRFPHPATHRHVGTDLSLGEYNKKT